MLYKAALTECSPLDVSSNNETLIKTASGILKLDPQSDKARVVAEEVGKHPNALFFRAKAIKSDEPNSNGDYFSEEELLKSYASFVGVPFFTNHDNQNVENARGKIIHAEWVAEESSVYTIAFVDRDAYPNICRSIEEDYINGVSMGCSVEHSICNLCGNKAETTEQYCSHIRNKKGRKFSGTVKDVNTGEVRRFRDEPVFEYNYGLKFIELSAVVDPACPSCRIEGIIPNDDYLQKVANLQNELFMVKSAAIEKQASQGEIDQIEQVLETLEGISVNLIQNRKQVEMEFASDLVDILSQLQTWLEELVGAGYGSVGNETGVPGTVGDDTGMAPGQEGMPQAPAPQPVAAEVPLGAEVGSVTGSPADPAVGVPELPITAPVMPRGAGAVVNRISNFQILEDNTHRQETGVELIRAASTLTNKMNKSGETEMARRTKAGKQEQQEKTKEILSSSWQEKRDFFEYIKKVPSLQDSQHKLAIKKNDDSFIIVAQSKDNDEVKKTWTYEDLTEEQKQLIKKSPDEAAVALLEAFTNQETNKEGANRMTDINRDAGANSVTETPEVVTEKQLEQSGLYHSRDNNEKHETTQAQLESKRIGEKEVLTEKQLDDSDLKLNPRVEKEAEVVTEAQLDGDNRLEDEKHEITQKQLDANRTDNEKEVVTEKQLDEVAAPWARQAERDSNLFKSASEHMEAVRTVIADSVIVSGCTPEEATEVSTTLVDSTQNRVDLIQSILEEGDASEEIDASKRLAFWSNKNLRVAGSGKQEIAKTIVEKLRVVASDTTYDPEVLIDAIDVISEGEEGVKSVETRVDERLSEAKTDSTKKTASRKAELRAALAGKTVVASDDQAKEQRAEERSAILAAASAKKVAAQDDSDKVINKKVIEDSDLVIETSFEEIGTKREAKDFRKKVVAFTKGAVASQETRLAAITNVTIAGDTIQIAVQTDDGEESVNIPIGENPMPAPEEIIPEGDMTGEGLDAALAAKIDEMKKESFTGKTVKEAQFGGGGGGVPGTAGVGSPDQMSGEADMAADPIEALTVGDEAGEEGGDEIPTIGEQQMPWTICPECGSSDVDVVEGEGGAINGNCNSCPAEYEALVKKQVEFKILNPSSVASGDEGEDIDTPEIPADIAEVPALPVAAQTRIDKNSIVRIGENRKKHGHVCPACGQTDNEVSVEADGHTEFKCSACKTNVTKDVLIAANDPEVGFLQVAWDLVPKTDCEGCGEEVSKFASKVKLGQLIKEATAKGEDFPMSNCLERLARTYGGDTVGTFGPCKGKMLADCVCGKLKSLGLRTTRNMEKLASASMAEDPMDECLEDQVKLGHDKVEAEAICGCVKAKYASDDADNIYKRAWAEDIKEGREKVLIASDLETIPELLDKEDSVVTASEEYVDEDIGAALPPVEAIKAEAAGFFCDDCKNPTASCKCDDDGCCKKCECDPCECKEDKDDDKKDKDCESSVDIVEEIVAEASTEEVAETSTELESQLKEAALALDGRMVRNSDKEVLKMASKPKQVKDIEGNVDAGVPRSNATIRNESGDNIDVPMAKPSVPRANAEMGHEGKDNVNPAAGLPDVAVDSSYMGDEKNIQSDMPAINNQIKGTVIADVVDAIGKDGDISDEAKAVITAALNKQAKKFKEVDTIEGDVEAGVPRGDATIGNEGKDNIDVAENTPDVPRADAKMGHEEEIKADAPDIPSTDAYLGNEKEVQKGYDHANSGKGMPENNREILKQVQQSNEREDQINKIAEARTRQAEKVTAWLQGNGRIASDLDSFNDTVQALSTFQIDKIAEKAQTMFPEKKIVAAAQKAEGHQIPAIVMQSTSGEEGGLKDALASTFTVGNKGFDHNLTIYGEK